MDRKIGAVILAAGKGTRMESDKAKVLHPVAGRPMLAYVLDSVLKLGIDRIAVVVGHQAEDIRRAFATHEKIHWVRQRAMRGTGDAVRAAAPVLRDFPGPVLVLYGDIPGIRTETLRRLAMVHTSSDNSITLLTAELEDPTGYGRIILEADGTVARIVEEGDASDSEKGIQEVNTGIGMYEPRFLFSAVKLLRPMNRQKEFYLTDLVEAAGRAGKTVGRFRLRDASEALGINDRESLAEVTGLFFDDKATSLLEAGVTLEDPVLTFVEPSAWIEKDSTLESLVKVRGSSRVARNVQIGVASDIDDSDIAEEVRIGRNVTIRRAKIGARSVIGANAVIGESLVKAKRGD